MPSQIQEISTPESLRKRFAVVGGLPGMAIDEVIVPVALVANLAEQPAPSAVRLAWGTGQQAAVAGQQSHIQLLNPASSGQIVSVQRLAITGPTAVSVSVRELDTALATLDTTFGWRDRGQAGNPVAEVRHTTNAGVLGAGRYAIAHIATDVEVVILDATLVPGTGLIAVASAGNVQLTASWQWTERPQSVEGL